VAAVAAALMVSTGDASVLPRLASVVDPAAYADRLEVWAGAFRAWTTSPAVGLGLGAFQVAAAPFFGRDRGVVYTRAENEYLDVLVEGGVVGLALVVVLLGSVVRLGARALRASGRSRDGSVILGGLFGVAALAVQSLGDFCLHIPGVAVTAVVLAAYLCGLGLEARVRAPEPAAVGAGAGPGGRRAWSSAVPRLAAAGLAVVVLARFARLAHTEALLAEAQGTSALAAAQPAEGAAPRDPGPASRRELEARRGLLERALRVRPGWAEGHLRLGETLLGLYSAVAADWLDGSETDEARVAMLADPLWLHAVVHGEESGGPVPAEDLLGHEPVRDYLVPAARAYLQARRCVPTLALPHARLAVLSFLLDGGDTSAAYARRALELAGAQGSVIALAARVVVQVNDKELAARCWRRQLEIGAGRWEDVADLADVTLPPDQILNEVLPRGGRMALLFADRLYADPADRRDRDRFLRAGIERLADDGLAEPERLHLEAEALSRLGEPGRARQRLEAALELDPSHNDWRARLAGWFLEAGDAERARAHALAGLRLDPGDPALRRMLEGAADTLARGGPVGSGGVADPSSKMTGR
jgi:tetratricopeptide (TPR) repeat protein